MPNHDDQDELSPRTLRRFRQRLEEHRQQTLQKMQQHVADALVDSGRPADEVDVAAAGQQQNLLLKLSDKERKLLKLIDHALRKFDTGEYGLCEGTGDPIALRRLEARPWVRYSVAYQEQVEREQSLRAKT